ncbi:MAG: hypothetical protein B6I22_06055 [Desulfobacteraceae bacterium 4572_123]|nr:MAG: hypothetical protein B6I22_06055 [Desulfobacteraceae bacterium 4572_123]
MEINILESRPAGYAYLLDRFVLTGMPHWHTSFVSSSGTHRSEVKDGATCDIYPARYWPGETVGDHLEFALKYDGVNLGLLAQIFGKSSFEIEHIKPNASRTEKFIASLTLAEKEDFCEKERLIELQNRIVDPRFKDSDYRDSQNYVGQTVAYQKEIIHFICPKPDDLPGLMAGLIKSHKRMKEGNVSPVIHAAAIAYGFVFLHPFEDGNGRIHRFLIHNILLLQKMVPRGLMFPVSAVMLKNPANYDASLTAFSRPLLGLIDYQLDEMGRMTVENDTACWYQYMEMTPQAEALYEFVAKTIKEELVQELNFLASYDNTRKAIQDIIDMPDRLIDLFIRMCLQNNGSLSAGKRSSHFDFLTGKELAAMEQAVKSGYAGYGN